MNERMNEKFIILSGTAFVNDNSYKVSEMDKSAQVWSCLVIKNLNKLINTVPRLRHKHEVQVNNVLKHIRYLEILSAFAVLNLAFIFCHLRLRSIYTCMQLNSNDLMIK